MAGNVTVGHGEKYWQPMVGLVVAVIGCRSKTIASPGALCDRCSAILRRREGVAGKSVCIFFVVELSYDCSIS